MIYWQTAFCLLAASADSFHYWRNLRKGSSADFFGMSPLAGFDSWSIDEAFFTRLCCTLPQFFHPFLLVLVLNTSLGHNYYNCFVSFRNYVYLVLDSCGGARIDVKCAIQTLRGSVGMSSNVVNGAFNSG